ncbi:FAD-dependent monooxygenase [Kitasatospora sp. RG8]|nr:FAD-dependent monooxygenase [Kitasatospora sp. RG8]
MPAQPRPRTAPHQEQTDVLIVGAGPTGLTLACDLARRGVRALLVERAAELFPGSRGKGLQPRTLEVFEDLGILPAVREAGGPYPRILSWQDGERQGEWDLVERSTADDPTVPYPDTWMLPQWRTQEILHARLRELGGEVRFGTALTGLDQPLDPGRHPDLGQTPALDEHPDRRPDRVTATLTGPDGGLRTVSAQYLVAADGGRGAVRRLAGIPMAGEQVDPQQSLVADVRVTGLDRDNWHFWPKGAGGPLLLCPLPGTADFQLLAQFGEHAEPDTSPAAVRELIAARTHLAAAAVGDVRWASAFRPSAALAERFRSGRVFLAGDAAHIHSPAGGQGLNTSIQDAYNLGWKLGQVLLHDAPEELLDSYEQERLPVAADVLEISTRLHRAGAVRHGRLRGPRTEQLGVGYPDGPLTVEARPGLPEEALRAGDRAPDAPLDGSPAGTRLFDLFRGPHVTVLAVGRRLPAVPAGVRAHRVDGGVAQAVYGEGLFVIRPDGYLGLATDDPADLPGYLARLGLR